MAISAFFSVCLLLLGTCPLSSSAIPLPPSRRSLTQKQDNSPGASCDRLDCPPYQAVHVESDFEIRLYSEATWAETTPILATSFMLATRAGFRRLFKYIRGENAERVKIPMTAPVLSALNASGGPFGSPTFRVKFYVPPKFSKTPPKPYDDLGVNIQALPAACVAIRRFPGFATDDNVAIQAKYLAQSLSRTAWVNVSCSHLYAIAQYNDPFTLLSRVNEVWLFFEGVVGRHCMVPPELNQSKSSAVL